MSAVIKLLVNRLREAWPDVRIIVRGDSGFCRQRLIRWCERQGVGYVIGVARNARLQRIVAGWERLLEHRHSQRGTKQHLVREFTYVADSWDRKRRIVTRLEFGAQGNNPRFVVTNLDLPAPALYDDLYCQRGEADQPEGRRTAEGWSREAGCGSAAQNRIKETQLDLFGTRASSHKFLANWLRVMFSALAYTLMRRFRAIALTNTELARAAAATIRVRLLKIGAAVIRNSRRVCILFASHHPLRDIFLTAAQALAP